MQDKDIQQSKRQAALQAASECTLQELVALAIQKGATFGDFTSALTETQSELENAYARYAQDHHQSDGSLEFDQGCVVSLSDDGGAYVQAWKWVPRSDIYDYYADSDEMAADDEESEGPHYGDLCHLAERELDVLGVITPDGTELDKRDARLCFDVCETSVSVTLRAEGQVLLQFDDKSHSFSYRPLRVDFSNHSWLYVQLDETEVDRLEAYEIEVCGWTVRMYRFPLADD